MTPTPGPPADRAAAVLRAAEAATVAGHQDDRAPAPARPASRPHVPGAADRLLDAADDLAIGVDDARDQLGALQSALERLAR